MLFFSWLLVLGLVPILEEFLEADIRKRMPDKLFNDFERDGTNVRADHRRLNDVQRVAHARHEHLCFKTVVPVNNDNLANEVHARMAHVIEASNERADEMGSRLRGNQRL